MAVEAHLTTTTLKDADEARSFLLAVGVQGPILHPNKDVPDLGYRPPYRWNGWNHTVAVGMDATGRPVVLDTTHYASTSSPIRFAIKYAEVGTTLGGKQEEPQYPIEVLPAYPVILYPEHTPKD